MNRGAVDHWEFGGLILECQKQIGTAEDNRLGAQILTHAEPGCEKHLTLCAGDPPGERHLAVTLVHKLA
jgi:hypothetical protein